MPSVSQHKMKYLENKQLLDNEMNIKSNTHYNWVTTIAFYAAVHLVEGELAKNDVHTTTHVSRDGFIEKYSAFRNIRNQYKFLHDKSVIARYTELNINQKKAEQAIRYLNDIEKEIQL